MAYGRKISPRPGSRCHDKQFTRTVHNSFVRVLHLDSGREWRGGQRQVYLLALAQRERGDEPLVVAAPHSPLAGRLKTQGIASATVAIRGDWDVIAMRRVRRLLSRWRPDIVHAHDAHGHAIALGALLGLGTPLIVTRRVPYPTRGWIKYGSRVTHFIAISRAVADALGTSGVGADQCTVVYSGVPAPSVGTARDWRREAGWPAGTLLCGVVGAMTAEKGVERLHAIAQFLAPDLRRRLRLVLLGGAARGVDDFEGIPAYRAGFVDAIHEAMAGLDMLWHPSDAEGLGTAVIDAMALGVPPVTFATGGLAEVVQADQSGLLAPPGDVRAFAHAVERLAIDASLRARLSAGGKRRAAEFSVERMVRGTAAVYERVLAAHAAQLIAS